MVIEIDDELCFRFVGMEVVSWLLLGVERIETDLVSIYRSLGSGLIINRIDKTWTLIGKHPGGDGSLIR